jgi:hypothetical protein
VAKLLNAKLYRMTVFHLLETPAYLADVALVEYVIGRLEKAGAGKLAARLRRTLAYWTDMGPEERAAAKPRLMPLERASSEPRPPTYWRVPNIPRDPSEYRGTPAERRTHYMNHRITSYLTVQHPAPYGMPRPPWPAPPLGRVQDVLKMIDRLRVTSNFVPDRVTVNIVVKAWLMSLSRRQDWGRLPLAHRKRDLRDIFGLVSSSIERGGSSSGSGVLHRPEEGEDGEPPLPFNGSVDYDRHVAPLAKTIIGAMRRVGDHDAIAAVKRWSEEMKVKLKEHKE